MSIYRKVNFKPATADRVLSIFNEIEQILKEESKIEAFVIMKDIALYLEKYCKCLYQKDDLFFSGTEGYLHEMIGFYRKEADKKFNDLKEENLHLSYLKRMKKQAELFAEE